MRTRKTITHKKSSQQHHSQPSRTNQTTLQIQKQITKRPKIEWTIDRLTTNYVPNEIVGRESQKMIIDNFVQNCLMNRIGSKVLYISGIPGVGKTASTMQILTKLQKQSKTKVNIGLINALTLKKPDQVYRLMLGIITGGQDKQHSKKTLNIVKKIEEVLPILRQPHIIVIDEVDYLMTKDQTIFYNLFEWVYQTTAKLGLIIIANTMDFPQKLSGKVNSRMGNNRVVFKPYSYEQIKNIIQDRLQGCKLFAANAVMFAAKKLSTYSSDIRTILQVLYKAVHDHIQSESKGKIKIEQIVALWDQKISQGKAQGKDENLTNLHHQILEYIKKHDNQCSSRDAADVFYQKGIKPHNLIILLKELEEMNYLTMTEQRGSMFPSYTLRLVQSFKL